MKKIKENNKLDVVFILDRRGSMHDCVLDTIVGYNSYLSNLFFLPLHWLNL